MSDLFEQLLACKWRDVEFPIIKVSMSLAHDLVEHKYWGVDGARVEATGLAPMRFSVSIPFINGIVPGKNERWGILYPNGMRSFLAAFADRRTGFFQHPEYGVIPCKPEHVSFELSGDHRGGMMCEATFVETLEDDVTINLIGESPVQDIELAALSLDASDGDLRALIPTFPKYQTSWADLARGIQSIADQATLLSNTTAGKINAIVYRVDNIEDSIDRAKSALTHDVTHALERVKEKANNLREKVLSDTNKHIVRFLVPGDTTIAGLLAQLPDAQLGDIIKLNPQLMGEAVVSKGTVVRYYSAKGTTRSTF